ncbi:lipase 3-like [Leguminivora glycinivorella]|uniref:lipase 3-like n=1 Tax=Leguminivora glycinivorella TaxID=1035111 RepID=UPI0020109358|nr:lipase 3-like [Leguminivora glycinivorella]
MISKTFIWSVLFSLSVARGQLLDLMLPQTENSTRALTNRIQTADNTPDLFDGKFAKNVLHLLSSVTKSVAKTMGSDKDVLDLLDNNVLISTRRNFVKDFESGRHNEDCHLSSVQLITKYGHLVETHETVTEDGYILTLLRIPSDGPVVFLMHGVFGSADDFLLSGPENSIAYFLAREGYDVWLGNSRGSKHSRRHQYLKQSSAKYWDISWHEIGYYDLPAMIDYTLNKTGQMKLRYIGYSQGSTCFLVMASERPAYNAKVSLMIALAPIGFLYNVKSPFARMLHYTPIILNMFYSSEGSKLYMQRVCGSGGLMESLFCQYVVMFVAGFNLEHLNATSLPAVLSHSPTSSSVKQCVHYAQSIVSGKFRQFDYGVAENMHRYGSRDPPDYELENINAPVAVIYSDGDWLSDDRDVEKLLRKLPRVVKTHKIERENFTHLDYVYSKNPKDLIHKRIIELLSRY